MDDFLTIEYLENAIRNIFSKGTKGKIIVRFPNEEFYNKYAEWLDKEIIKLNKHKLKTRRNKKKITITN